nr:hypothetical protein [Tanacetum cinerariifolium]
LPSDSLSRHIINLTTKEDHKKFSDIEACTTLSSREVPNFDGPEPQPLSNSPSLDVSLGDVIGPEPPIKPHSPDSSGMKVVDHLTTQTPPSTHVANSHPKEPQPLSNSPSLDVSLGDVIGPEPPIKPHSPDSSGMKVVDHLTTQTPPSTHV